MASSSSDDEEVEQPPATRAPSARGTKGNRMRALMQDEAEDENKDDHDFYTQHFWAEDEHDQEYDAEDEDANDSFDSDFGDSTESDDDEDENDDADERARPSRKRSVYVDPKKRATDGANKKPRAARAVADASDIVLPPLQVHRGSLRGSTQAASKQAEELRRKESERLRQRAQARVGFAKGVELRRLTQEEILAEASQTEIINRASLEKMLRVEEEKRKVIVRDRASAGPRVRMLSSRVGDSVTTTLTFSECNLPAELQQLAPPPPASAVCAVTGKRARYRDPLTGAAYATVEAFRHLRGERRVRPPAVAASQAHA